jgi:rhamnulokinase
MSGTYAAVDLGAASGRVILGRVEPDRVRLTEVHRFDNDPLALPDGLHWDIAALYRNVQTGLRAAAPHEPASAGIDSWAVDYGLLDGSGALLGLPFHYRDPRTTPDDAARPDDFYAIAGIAPLPFNTINQLRADDPERLAAARTLLMIPDLLTYWLTGVRGSERTNASTTQLYDATAHTWSDEIIAAAKLPRGIFGELHDPGTRIGPLRSPVRTSIGLACDIVAVGSHDTASAVAALPASGDDFAYISCGTWSLVGVELTTPVLTPAARDAMFTNEAGLDGTIRFLRNVMGLWLLQQCQDSWPGSDLGELLAGAAHQKPFTSVVNPDSQRFLSPGDMPSRIDRYCRETGQPIPESPAAYVRCILESLALAHRAAVRTAEMLSGRAVQRIHMVGGGARNQLLCRLTADATGLPVVAGPVEATALGNVLTQARTAGGPSDLAAMRALVAASEPGHRYAPDSTSAPGWDAAAARIGLG